MTWLTELGYLVLAGTAASVAAVRAIGLVLAHHVVALATLPTIPIVH